MKSETRSEITDLWFSCCFLVQCSEECWHDNSSSAKDIRFDTVKYFRILQQQQQQIPNSSIRNPNLDPVQELQQYLGKDLDLDSALTFWLCQDEVSSADDAAMTWWKRLLEWIKPTGFSGIDDAIYKQLVAR